MTALELRLFFGVITIFKPKGITSLVPKVYNRLKGKPENEEVKEK